jgi:hypothetical protein
MKWNEKATKFANVKTMFYFENVSKQRVRIINPEQ